MRLSGSSLAGSLTLSRSVPEGFKKDDLQVRGQTEVVQIVDNKDVARSEDGRSFWPQYR